MQDAGLPDFIHTSNAAALPKSRNVQLVHDAALFYNMCTTLQPKCYHLDHDFLQNMQHSSSGIFYAL